MEHMLYILVGKGQGTSFKLEPGKEYNFNIESVKPTEKRIVLKLAGKAKVPEPQEKVDGEESV